MRLSDLRERYHEEICKEIIRIQTGNPDYPNFADKTNKASRQIAWGVVNRMRYPVVKGSLKGQTAGDLFERLTRDFLRDAFELLQHLRPGHWKYSTRAVISEFDQYQHLAELERVVMQNSEFATTLGREYIIAPDIVIGRSPVTDEEINATQEIVSDNIAVFTPLRKSNSANPQPFLHASISCKWTLRSDRGQNARTEALNLIRHRKGHLPHIVAVTAEPLPTRIASLALGTGDLDCVYHFALYEMKESIVEAGNEDQLDMLETLMIGRRLRDISDLPFDMAV